MTKSQEKPEVYPINDLNDLNDPEVTYCNADRNDRIDTTFADNQKVASDTGRNSSASVGFASSAKSSSLRSSRFAPACAGRGRRARSAAARCLGSPSPARSSREENDRFAFFDEEANYSFEKKEEERKRRKVVEEDTLCNRFENRTFAEALKAVADYRYARLDSLMAEIYEKKDNDVDTFRLAEERQLPAGSVDFPVLAADEIKKLLGRKFRNQLSNLLKLVEVFQFLTSNDCITVLTLSSRSKHLVSLFGTAMTVSRVIKTAETVGLLKCVESQFHFSSWSAYARKYAWNKQAQQTIKALCETEGITSTAVLKAKGPEEAPEADLEALYAAAPDKYRLTSSTRLDGVSDDLMRYGIRRNYPMIREYEKKVAELNETLPLDERIKFEISVTRSKAGLVTKAGIRATNPLVSLKDEKHCADGETCMTRQKMLKAKFGRWTEIDVRSSVPRVTYLLNKGVWLPQSVDLYERMYGKPFASPEARRNFKNLFMALYFDSSAKQAQNHFRLKHQTDDFVARHGKAETVETIAEARDAVRDYLGDSFGSEIFLHESCIYIDVFKRLREEGYQVIQCYDGFFLKGWLTARQEARVWSLIRECAESYYAKWRGVICASRGAAGVSVEVPQAVTVAEVREAIAEGQETPNADFWARFAAPVEEPFATADTAPDELPLFGYAV